MSSHVTVCGNCYQPISFVIGDLELRQRPDSNFYPDGFLMVRCTKCEHLNAPCGMLDYEAIKQEWSKAGTNQAQI